MARHTPLVVTLGAALLISSACSDTVAPAPEYRGPISFDDAALVEDLEGSSFAEGESFEPVEEMLATLGLAASATSGEGVVLPQAYTWQMGNFNNRFPHAMHNMRYQQVFLGSELQGLKTVSAVCLRRDEVSGGAAQTQQLVVRMGPTMRDHNTLGPVFDANYSDTPTEVFDGELVLPANSGRGHPEDFYLCIEFSKQYRHPEGANVILEVVNRSPSSLPHFSDACSRTVSGPQCTTRRTYAMSATATTGVGVFNSGLIVKFMGRTGTVTNTTSQIVPFDQTIFGCTEPIAFTGSLHFVVTETITPSGSQHFMSHAQPQGVTGTGLVSGAKYQATGATIQSVTMAAGGAQTNSYVNNFRLIGQGPEENRLVHENFHVTFNANGELTVIHDNFSFECR